MTLIDKVKRFWRHFMCDGCVDTITVGIRSNATIDVDFSSINEEDGVDWNNNNLSIPQAEFLLQELEQSIARAKLRKAHLDSITKNESSCSSKEEYKTPEVKNLGNIQNSAEKCGVHEAEELSGDPPPKK